MNSQPRYRRNSSRRGAVLIVLLAVFAVIMTLAGVWARRIVTEHRQSRRIAERAQVQWLAEGGVRRAAAQLAADPDFAGEEWQITAEELSRTSAARVILRVEPNGDARGRFRIVAEARYPEQNPRARVTKTVFYTPPSSEPAS